MKKTIALIVAVASLAAAGNVLAAGDAAAGKAKAASCAACHGPGGNSKVNPLWPNLAGQHAVYIVKQLKDFKSGARKDPMMSPMAMPLSDQDMENLGAYYASEKQI
jgi:cytochrome c553